MAHVLNFKIDQGTDSHLSFSFNDYDSPLDLTGYEAAMQIRSFYNSSTAVDTLTTKNGRLILDVEKSRVTAIFPNSKTRKYPPRRCVYDMELFSSDGKIYRILEGQIFISAEVTRVNSL